MQVRLHGLAMQRQSWLWLSYCRWLSRFSWLHAALKAGLQEALLQVLLARSQGRTMLVGRRHW